MSLQAELSQAKQDGSVHQTRREHSEGCFAVSVKDNANSPELEFGDIVVVDPGAVPEPGDVVYIEVRTNNGCKRTFRIYGEGEYGALFVPFNGSHVFYTPGVPGTPGIVILGKAVELSRSFSLSASRYRADDHAKDLQRRFAEAKQCQRLTQLQLEIEALKREQAAARNGERKPRRKSKASNGAAALQDAAVAKPSYSSRTSSRKQKPKTTAPVPLAA